MNAISIPRQKATSQAPVSASLIRTVSKLKRTMPASDIAVPVVISLLPNIFFPEFTEIIGCCPRVKEQSAAVLRKNKFSRPFGEKSHCIKI